MYIYIYIYIVNNIPHGYALLQRIMYVVRGAHSGACHLTIPATIWAQVYVCTASDSCAGAERARARPPPESEDRWPAMDVF